MKEPAHPAIHESRYHQNYVPHQSFQTTSGPSCPEIYYILNSAKNYPHNKIWCVFQPHTYSRTKALMPEFAKALSLADNIVLAKIYPARETDNLGISSADLMELIKAEGKDCYYYESFEDIEKFLLNNCINGDLLITMGAGDVYKIGEELLK